jgi:hypothetical protein
MEEEGEEQEEDARVPEMKEKEKEKEQEKKKNQVEWKERKESQDGKEKQAKEQEKEKESEREEDLRALEELEINAEEVVEETETAMGGRLMDRAERWEKIGNREMVENGVAAEWIDGPPTEAADYTRRERYAGEMHLAMLRAIAE